jgi:hypothetical protein
MEKHDDAGEYTRAAGAEFCARAIRAARDALGGKL